MATASTPPKCPRFLDADPTLFERYACFIQDAILSGTSNRGIEWHQQARVLASDLHSEAMTLGMSRAHEYSDDIYWLDQCAAVVSFIAFGRLSNDFEKYQAAVHYYAAFPNTKPRVIEFDHYVQGA
jgi:hypothetical protein